MNKKTTLLIALPATAILGVFFLFPSKNIYNSDTDAGLDISIPMLFNGPQPNTYGVPPASAQAYRDGSFVGDTREGGSCNFETYILTPHCNGTHTEGIGHLTRERIQVSVNASDTFMPACLLSVQPQSPAETKDTYTPELNPSDLVITLASIQNALSSIKDWSDCPAIIIRTLPNHTDKKSRNYMEHSPAFFSHEAMRFLNLIANKLFSLIFTWLLDQRIKDTLCGTKVISKKNYDALAANRSYFGDFDPFGDFDLLFGAAKLNLKIIEIPVRYRARTYGDTKISRFRHGWLLFRMCGVAMRKLKFL